jgi:hypothetical protein
MSVLVGVVSANRPMNVVSMAKWLDNVAYRVRWYVPGSQAGEYKTAGALVRPVEGQVPMKALQLNALLDDAAEGGFDYAINLDDDLALLKQTKPQCRNKGEHITLQAAIEELCLSLSMHESKLAGPAPTPNLLHVLNKPACVFDRYPAGQFGVHQAPFPFRYDHNLEASEDWDMFLQHVDELGGVVRVNTILAAFTMGKNRGGFQSIERDELDRRNRQKLAEKWPQYVIWPHPKRGPLDIEVRVNGHSAR